VTANPPYPRENLAGDQERVQHVNLRVQEVIVAAHEVVLVATESVSAEVVDGVVVDAHGIVQTQFLQSANDLALSCPIIRYQVAQETAFSGGVLKVGADSVDIQPGPVHQEAAGMRRLEYVVSSMKVYRPETKFLEQVVLYDLDGVLGSTEGFVRDETSEFRFDAKNPIHGRPCHTHSYYAHLPYPVLVHHPGRLRIQQSRAKWYPSPS